MIFTNRKQAGKLLADRLEEYRNDEPIVLALPRGGVLVGAKIARRLRRPLGVVVVRKIGHPYNPELAIGAVSEHALVMRPQFSTAGIEFEKKAEVERKERGQSVTVERERKEIERRKKIYEVNEQELLGRTVILTDDGAATGLSMRVAIEEVRKRRPEKIISAVPVASPEAVEIIQKVADRLVVLETPDPSMFEAVGQYYREFEQVRDEDVVRILWRFKNLE